jgi:tRNA dimethylallyltransferase
LDDRETIPILTGCTASGKTALLMGLSDRNRIEVISADSRQVYRGMDIGTAKPTLEERRRIPHYLLDLVDPDGEYSAGRFAADAAGLITAVRGRGAIPVVAGGTGLYIMALTGSLDEMPSADDGLRGVLRSMESAAPGTLMRFLMALDPARAEELHSADTVRQLRSLEVCLLTGIRVSCLRKGGAGPDAAAGFRIAAIHVESEELRLRIARRTQEMLRGGLLGEVEALRTAGWDRQSALGRTIGYREALDYLDGSISSLDALHEAISVSTWRLSRRQTNMYRRIAGLRWISEADELASFILEEGER